MKKASKSYKIIVDSNIWISFLIGKNLKGLQNHIDSKFITIITCDEQFFELSEVFKKSKISSFFSPKQIFEFFELLNECSEKVLVITKSNLKIKKYSNEKVYSWMLNVANSVFGVCLNPEQPGAIPPCF